MPNPVAPLTRLKGDVLSSFLPLLFVVYLREFALLVICGAPSCYYIDVNGVSYESIIKVANELPQRSYTLSWVPIAQNPQKPQKPQKRPKMAILAKTPKRAKKGVISGVQKRSKMVIFGPAWTALGTCFCVFICNCDTF